MNKPHVHAELIKAWADGAEIEYFDNHFQKWAPIMGNPTWRDSNQYRIKPERVFPKSKMSDKELYLSAFPFITNIDNVNIEIAVYNYLRKVADEAIKQYILETENGK